MSDYSVPEERQEAIKRMDEKARERMKKMPLTKRQRKIRKRIRKHIPKELKNA